jgi:hypothetical protein
MDGSLGTTNVLLGIMAAVSVLEGLLIIGVCVACLLVYRKATALYRDTLEVVVGLERRQVAPAMARVNAILDDFRSVSATVKGETDRVDHAIHHTIDRVDDTVDRMRSSVRVKTSRLVGFMRGARVALETVFENR